MRAQNELLDAIQILIDKAMKDRATKITGGKVKSASGGLATVTINGYDYSIPYSGTTPTANSTVRVFIPNGNMSDAFIGGGGSGGGSSAVNYNGLTNKPTINGVVLQGNKTTSDLGIKEDRQFVFTQTTPIEVWAIQHSMEKFPAVTTVDSAGNEIIGDVTYLDTNNVTVTFTSKIAGKAYLN